MTNKELYKEQHKCYHCGNYSNGKCSFTNTRVFEEDDGSKCPMFDVILNEQVLSKLHALVKKHNKAWTIGSVITEDEAFERYLATEYDDIMPFEDYLSILTDKCKIIVWDGKE